MALVPRAEELPDTPLRITRDVVAIPDNAAIEATGRFMSAAQEAVNRIVDQQNEASLNAADTQAAVDLEDIAERYRTDDDWQTAPQRARAEAEERMRQHGAGLRGAASQRVWTQRSIERLGRFDLGMRAQSRERGMHLARADLLRQGEAAEAIAGDLNRGEDTRRTAVTNYAGTIQGYVDRGLLDPDDAVQLEQGFGERVRERVRNGLQAEITERLDLDPGDLAGELDDDDGPFRELAPAQRAAYARQARQNAASQAVDEALSHTLRTGEILSEDHPSLAGGWDHLGDGARLRYAQQASGAAETHRQARELGELSGLSLAEIAVRADEARERGETGGGVAGVSLRVIRRDPAAYVGSSQPNIQRLQQAASAAIEAARQAPDDAEAQGEATRARRAWAAAMVNAQSAMGLSSGQIRLHAQTAMTSWARRIRALPPERQQAALDRLPEQMLRMYGDENLAERATLEHMEAFYANQSGSAAPPPAPASSAAQGADYGEVRQRILGVLRSGGWDARADVLLSRLPPGDRDRLMQDPDIAAAMGGGE